MMEMLRRPRSSPHGQQSSSRCVVSSVCVCSNRLCDKPALVGFQHCLKHILQDKCSPYRRCSYTSVVTHRRCTKAGLRMDPPDCKGDRTFCQQHLQQSASRRWLGCCRKRPQETTEGVLRCSVSVSTDNEASCHLVSGAVAKTLDWTSSSDSESELAVVGQRAACGDDEEDEGVDSEVDDCLKHAEVYTGEEAVVVLRDKMTRLRDLYRDQFKYLTGVLHEEQRRYLRTVKPEHDALGPITVYRIDPIQCRGYARLRALRRYRTFRGKEAVMRERSTKRRRAVAAGVNYRPGAFYRCQALVLGRLCYQRCLPLTKVCMDHILDDTEQVLFQQCKYSDGGNKPCRQAVLRVTDGSFCRRHYSMAPSRVSVSCQGDVAGEPCLQAEEEHSGARGDEPLADG